MFLAQLMNRVPGWTVRHEPHPRTIHPHLPDLQLRFDRDRYGEVNSLLRVVANEIKVRRRAVILRHPREITESFYTKIGAGWRGHLDRFLAMFESVSELATAGTPVIWFDLMTTTPAYLEAVCGSLTGEDPGFQVTDELISARVNSLGARVPFRELPDGLRSAYERHIASYEERYFGDEAAGCVDLI